MPLAITKEVRDEIEKLGHGLKVVGDLHKESAVESNDKFAKIEKSTADAIEKLTKIEISQKAFEDSEKKKEDQILALEKRLARGVSAGEVKGLSDFDIQYSQETRKHLRQNAYRIPDELQIKKVAHEIKKFAPTLSQEELAIVTKTYQEGFLQDGGFFVVPEYSPEQVIRRFETSPIRQFATTITSSTLNMRFFINDGLTGATNQAPELTLQTPAATAQFGELTITAHVQQIIQLASNEILQDPLISFEQLNMDKINQSFALNENQLFMTGDGVNEATGLLTYTPWTGAAVQIGDDSNYTRESLEYIQSGSTTGLTYDGLVNIQNALVASTAQANSASDNNPNAYAANARFFFNRTTWGDVLKLKDTQDRPLFQLQNLLRDGASPIGILLGQPVTFLSGMPQTSSGVDSPVAFYGDMRTAYTITDRLGMQIIRDIYTQAASRAVRWIAYKRMGAALTNYQSLKVLSLNAFSNPLLIQTNAITASHVQNIEDAKRIAAEEIAAENLASDKESLIAAEKEKLRNDKSFMSKIETAKAEALKLTSESDKASAKSENLKKTRERQRKNIREIRLDK